MNIKTGTQTWSKNPQPGIQHADNVHTASALDEQKMFGNGEKIGDVINRVVDPNWVDPTKKPRTVGNNELGKDAFMNLLITQMKNQDPTNPLKSHEMAAQLAQFTSLEKLTNIDQGINKLRTDSKPDKNFEALALIGKTVVTDSSKFSRLEQKGSQDLRFRLAADAMKATVTIKDAKGNIVRNLTFNNLKKGKNDLAWNGELEDGTQAPLGDYTMEVDARGSNGARIFAQMKSKGTITGINFTQRGPQVMVGHEAIDLSDIKSISEAGTDEETPGIPSGQAQAKPAIPPGAAAALANLMPSTPGKGGVSALPPTLIPPSLQAANDGQVPGAAPAPHETLQQRSHMMPVKPEAKADSAKRVKLAQGNLSETNMATSMMHKLEKEGVDPGA